MQPHKPPQIPQPGPFRRYAENHPLLMDWLVAGGFALIYLVNLVVIMINPQGYVAARAEGYTAVIRPLYLDNVGVTVGLVVAMGVSGTVALLAWRRTHPVWLAVFALASDCALAPLSGSPDAVLALIALFTVAQRCSARAMWISGTVWILGTFACEGVFGHQPDGPFSASNFAEAIALSLVVSVFAHVGARRRYIGALVETAEALAQERDQRAQVAVARERERISREMHDVVAHSIAVMVTLSDGAQALIEKDPAQACIALERVSETGRHAVSDMRRLLALFGPGAELGPQPGVADLVPLVESFRESGLPVQLELAAGTPDDPALGLAIYRTVQESLTNVLRHAPSAPWVEVKITEPAPDQRTVLIQNGPPATPDPAKPWDGSGQGIVGMRQRVEVFGGTLQAGPTEDGGWAVGATLKEA
ncbi:MAG: histidine kinase [Bifidobacteriaceae bacterium]|jgi:signal transduction histidine kinase|nr:histidine kinase [Bifidobacteriaceae bacterium]